MRSGSGVAGFSMIETLIATALMVAILAALATVTGQWLPSWNRGFARVQRAELAGIGLERLLADLAAAEFVPPNGDAKEPLFDGAALSVTFVRSALGPNTRPGLEIVRIAEAADERGLALVRVRAPFTPIQAGERVEPKLSDPVVLLRAPYRVSFSYAGVDRVWRDTWRQARLPSAVRVLVRDAATGQALAMSSATVVHVNVAAECVRANPPEQCKPKADAAGPAQAPKPAGGRPL